MTVPPFPLAGRIPTVRTTDPADPTVTATDMHAAAEEIRTQLTDWGFMAVELPGFGARVAQLTAGFADACRSTDPVLTDFGHDVTPQLSAGGTHGFFPYNSEIPRLAGGVPDPKEFIHVSGAMLADRPAGAAAVLAAFPALASSADAVFTTAFDVLSHFAQAIRGLLPPSAPALELSRDATNLRIIRYRDVRGREVLAHEHSGIQMLGLQLPPGDQGLQYVLHDGTWVEPVIAGTDVVLCNIGRMLAMASDGRFRPSTHRVHVSGTDANYERLSSVLFAYPPHDAHQWRVDGDGTLEVLDPTWGDFIAHRFAGLGAS